MSKFLNLDPGFLYIADTLALLMEAKKRDDIFDAFILNVGDLMHHIDCCIFIVSDTVNQSYREEIIDADTLNCFRQIVPIDRNVHLLDEEGKLALKKRYVNVLNERVNAVKSIVFKTTELENLHRKYRALKKERQVLIPIGKSLFTLPTYLFSQIKNKRRLSNIECVNIALFTIEESYQSLIDAVR